MKERVGKKAYDTYHVYLEFIANVAGDRYECINKSTVHLYLTLPSAEKIARVPITTRTTGRQ